MAAPPNTWSVNVMTDFIKKSCTYFAGTVTFLIAIKASFSIATTWEVLALIASFAAIACAAIAWLEVRGRTTPFGKRNGTSDEVGSVTLTLRRAFEAVKYAARDDESIASQANKIIRRGLDKRCIRYKDYKRWRHKNPAVFTAIIDDCNQLLGFFDIFPLTEEAATGLLNGWLHEHDLTIDSILPFKNNADAKKIYIASIMENPQQRTYSHIVARDIVVMKCLEFLVSTFPAKEDRMLFAYAHTDMGERLLKNAGFTNTALSQDNKQHRALYILSPEGYKESVKTFDVTSGVRVRSLRRKVAPNMKMQPTRYTRS
jgi:hypothetical protein